MSPKIFNKNGDNKNVDISIVIGIKNILVTNVTKNIYTYIGKTKKFKKTYLLYMQAKKVGDNGIPGTSLEITALQGKITW